MKIFTGKVIHTKMAKTARVDVTQTVAHALYGKRMKKTKIYLVHDEMGAKENDIVKFVACKPISKKKKWKVVEIVGDKPTKKKVVKKTTKKTSKTKKS